MKAIFNLIFFLLFINSFSQKSDYIFIRGQVSDTSETGLSEVTVKLKTTKNIIATVKTDSLGNYSFDTLNLNHSYEIHFYKRGYCYKFAKIYAYDLSNSGEFYGEFPMEVNVTLFKVKGIKAMRLRFMRKEPAAWASYNSKKDNMEWNLNHIQDYQRRVSRVID